MHVVGVISKHTTLYNACGWCPNNHNEALWSHISLQLRFEDTVTTFIGAIIILRID